MAKNTNRIFIFILLLSVFSIALVNGSHFDVEACDQQCYSLSDNFAISDCTNDCSDQYGLSLPEHLTEPLNVIEPEPVVLEEIVVEGFDLEACHSKCAQDIPETDYAGFGECTIKCDNLEKAEKETVKETIYNGEVEVTPLEVEEVFSEEERLGCKSIGGNIKSCSIKGYDSFTINEDANIVERNGQIVITSSEGETATIQYLDGSKARINEGEEYLPLKIQEEKQGFFTKITQGIKNFWNNLFKSRAQKEIVVGSKSAVTSKRG